MTTPGFKRQVSFSEFLPAANGALTSAIQTRSDLAQGRMTETGNPLDLAIQGDGFFRLRSGDTIVYSRQGQFQRAADGTVVTPQGLVLQQADGGDLILDGEGAIEILADGMVMEGERPAGRIALFTAGDAARLQPLGGSTFLIPEDSVEEVAAPALRQGAVEASNVTLGDEMVGMMTAIRQAEGGARLIMVYDELLGRAITAFGQSGR